MLNSGGITVGVVGTGFLSRHFVLSLRGRRDFRVGSVLTRRATAGCGDFPLVDRLTRDLARLVDSSDLIVECSGDPIHAADVVAAAVAAGRPVVTMNAEFHVTAGSAFTGGVVVTDAEGDQPGSLAALAEETRMAGFEPLVYGSLKGFLDHLPSPESMKYWAQRQGISVPMTTSFTDGTKLQIEQALVCNGLGATIASRGMVGPAESDLEIVARKLVPLARAVSRPIADYAVSLDFPHGVFIVADHDPQQQAALRYLKLGEGPHYLLVRQSILAHLEIIKTIRRVVDGGDRLIDNSANPRVGVAAVAKRRLDPGTGIERAIGSFQVRGEAVLIAEAPEHVPIGLLAGAVVQRTVEEGETVGRDDVEIPESLAARCWEDIRQRALAAPGA